MAKKRKVIITNNKEIYSKFNMLHFSSEILLQNVKKVQVDRILKNINRESDFLTSEVLGNYILVKKTRPFNFSIYLR